MELQTITYLIVGATFALYLGIAFWARAGSTSEFYVAGGGVNPVMNGMATAADWMSAASFISMAGLISNMGYGGAVFLMGWTGGYVLLAMLLAPYLRKFGKFTVPEFIGDRFYSKGARTIAVICLLVASITYIIGQMTGVGVAFSRFLGVALGGYLGSLVGQRFGLFLFKLTLFRQLTRALDPQVGMPANRIVKYQFAPDSDARHCRPFIFGQRRGNHADDHTERHGCGDQVEP